MNNWKHPPLRRQGAKGAKKSGARSWLGLNARLGLETFSKAWSLCVFLALLTHALTASAIGDSGGCSGFDSPERKAASEGDAKALLAVIWNKVDYEEAKLGWVRKAYYSLNKADRREWRESAAKSIANGEPIAFSDSCGNSLRPSLLTMAVWSGNVDATRALLELGANPNAPRFDNYKRLLGHLFIGCDRVTAIVEEKRLGSVERQIEALKLVLAAGGDLNLTSAENHGGLSGLHVCADPKILRFYLENGANPRAPASSDTPVKRAVYQLFQSDSTDKNNLNRSYEVQEERIATLLAYGKVRLSTEAMLSIRTECELGKKEAACKIFKRLFPEVEDLPKSYTRFIP